MKRGLALILIVVLAACGSNGDEEDGPQAELTQSTAPPPLVSTQAPTALATDDSRTATPVEEVIEPRDYVLGPDDAAVTIVMYSDFQCARCARYARDLEVLRASYPDELRLIWRHLPDTASNDKAVLALQIAEAAATQGRFWDMHAILFTTQPEWRDLSLDEFRAMVLEQADSAGFDVARLTAALDDERYLPLAEDYQEQADALGIVGVPTLLINGEPLNDRDDLYGLDGMMRLALLSEQHFDEPPPMSLDLERDYQAVISTEHGEIRIDLFEQDAPVAVNNFVFLVEQGWYDDTGFFLVIPGFYAQAGDPSETGRGYPGYYIAGEHDNGYVFDQAGLVAMSHPPGELDRNGSQFFITYEPLPGREDEWDGQYTIFGEVVDGLEVLDALTPRNQGDPLRFPNPPPGDELQTISIEIY